MNTKIALVVVLCFVAGSFLAAKLSAQGPTTVQLPTFSVFSVDTSVLVPDGGSASLGGISRAADGSISRGFGPGPLFSNRGLAGTRGASGVSVHATIIDHEALDKAVLAEAAARRGDVAEDAKVKKGMALGEKASARAGGGSTELLSVAELRRRNSAQDDAQLREAAELWEKAAAYEADQKPAVARQYYLRAARLNVAQYKQRALARAAALAVKNR